MTDLKQLRYFLAVAEELNFTRAAERLHISQPPLSMQIKALEEDLGVKLLERTNRGVVLSHAGEAFYEEVLAVFDRLALARAVAQRRARGEIGRLSVGFVSIADYSILPETLKRFREQCPGVDLQLVEETTDVQIQELHARRIDIGIALAPINDDALTFVPLIQEGLILAIPQTHADAHRRRPSLKRFRDQPFVSVPRQFAPGLHDAVHEYCALAGFTPQILQHARQMQTIISIVSAGMGIALIPSSLSRLQRSGVAYVIPKEPSPNISLGLVYRTGNDDPVLRHFIQAANEIALAPGRTT